MVMLRVRVRVRVRVRPQNWIFQIHNIQDEMFNPIMVLGGCMVLQDKVEVLVLQDGDLKNPIMGPLWLH